MNMGNIFTLFIQGEEQMTDSQLLRWLHEYMQLERHENPKQAWMKRLKALAKNWEDQERVQKEQALRAGWWDDLMRHQRRQRTNSSGSRQARKEER